MTRFLGAATSSTTLPPRVQDAAVRTESTAARVIPPKNYSSYPLEPHDPLNGEIRETRIRAPEKIAAKLQKEFDSAQAGS